MSKRPLKLARYRQAAQKAADWLESKQQANGAIDRRGGLASAYKTTFALVTAGRLPAAWRLLDYVAQHYMTEPGEFHNADESEWDKATTLYRNGYILKAAIRLGRFDIASEAALKRCLQYQHRSGGFLSGLSRTVRNRIDPLHTAMGGWLCLYWAKTDRAVRAGDFLVNLIENQPAMPDRFYFKTDARTGRCITEHPEGQSIGCYADRQRSKQHFFYAGAIMGYLSDLYRATQRRVYLNAARKMYAFEQGMNPRGYAWPSKCKVGWGAALLYSVTLDAAHRRMAEKVADVTFVKAQHADGSWDPLDFPIYDDGRSRRLSNVEITAEFTFELCEIAKALR
jgi:hypothetical protein